VNITREYEIHIETNLVGKKVGEFHIRCPDTGFEMRHFLEPDGTAIVGVPAGFHSRTYTITITHPDFYTMSMNVDVSDYYSPATFYAHFDLEPVPAKPKSLIPRTPRYFSRDRTTEKFGLWFRHFPAWFEQPYGFTKGVRS